MNVSEGINTIENLNITIRQQNKFVLFLSEHVMTEEE